MSYKLFLDDVRTPESTFQYMRLPVYNAGGWEVVRDYEEFLFVVKTRGIPEVVSFDHDLADFHYLNQELDYENEAIEKTGFHCAKWFIYHCLDNDKKLPPLVIVHSMNESGSLNIKSLFDTFYKVYGLEYEPVRMNPLF
jgi:hypothetical protein